MIHGVQRKNGFTIVELMVVIVVIGILAAIVTISYSAITDQSSDHTLNTDVQTAASALAKYKADNGAYPENIEDVGDIAAVNSNFQYIYSNHLNKFCITATSEDKIVHIISGNSSPKEGGCPEGWGEAPAPITNLAPNPSAEVSVVDFTGPNSSTVARSTVRSHTGASSVLVTMPGGVSRTNVGAGVFRSSGGFAQRNLKPDTLYRASAYVYVPAGTPTVWMSIQSAGVAWREDPVTRLTTGAQKDQWVRIENVFKTAVTSNTVNVFILNNEVTPSAATQFWVDSIMVTETDAPHTYADGNSPGWVWSGTPGLSSSTGPAL